MCSVRSCGRSDKISDRRTQLTVSSVGGIAESRLVIRSVRNSETPKFGVATCLHGYVARVSVQALVDNIQTRFQGSKVNTGLYKRSAIVRGNYRMLTDM